MTDHLRDAHAVLLPAFAGLELDAHLQAFLRNGGRSLLLGETREEYVDRAMSAERRANETAAHIRGFVDAATALADGPLIIAVDQEPAGICRLHDLVTPLPDLATLHQMSSTEIEAKAAEVALAARRMGVTLLLAPIVDVVHGENPWLARRTLGTDAAEVGRIASAFVRGVQSAGVTAMAKHFPGHPATMGDPANSDARQSASLAEVEAGLAAFAAVIAAGVGAIMTGPCVVEAIDPVHPASLSPAVMRLLRQRFGFQGLIISDDLDAKATLRDSTLADVAVASLTAGADLLLLAAGPHLGEIALAIAAAVAEDRLPEARLADAASRVRALSSQTPAQNTKV